MKKRSISLILIVALLMVIVAGCGEKKTVDEESSVKTSFMMGTMVTVKVYGPQREEVAKKVLDELNKLENLMSVNIESSEISAVNAKAGVEPVKVSDDTFVVVKKALEFAEKTGGLFDPTILPLVKLWGIGTKAAKVPTQAEIDALLPMVDYRNVIVDDGAQTIYLTQKGMGIDVGGIAKGYAADKAIQIYRDNDVKSAFINIGGNVMVHGAKPGGKLWNIGIQDPRAIRDELMATIELKDQAVVTSGDYERYFERNGVRYHHILNPKTGYPADTQMMSASIIGEKSMEADGLSTSVFLLGQEKGIALAQEYGFEVMVITNDKKIIMTEGLEGRMNFTNEEYSK